MAFFLSLLLVGPYKKFVVCGLSNRISIKHCNSSVLANFYRLKIHSRHIKIKVSKYSLLCHCSLLLHTMLKIPEHQVAGHKASDGLLGPLVDDSGRFYKPLQDDERGSREVTFYTSFSSNTRVPDHIRRFFSYFYGTQLLEASDGSGLRPHLVLQDVVSSHLHPSIMDIKIGSRTWYPQAPEDYIQRCLKKDRETSSLSLGFRISGLQVHGNKELGHWKPERKVVQKLTADEVRLALRKFVSSNSSADPYVVPDSLFASSVYGGSSGILAQLLELKAWFEDQSIYHFNSCSVLIVYEKESVLKGGPSGAQVKLIDFAHVVEGNGVIDHNFLGGVCSLIKFISEILTTPDECLTTNCLQDSERAVLTMGTATGSEQSIYNA